jgi:ribosomal protein S12 methylthiotransferase
MKRGSHAAAFLKMLEKIRATIPGVSIRTSFIVGFPGETERDFEELCEFVKEAEFDWMGVFEYSDEDAAKSCAFNEKVDSETISVRKNVLLSLQQGITKRKLRQKLHFKLHAILEGPSKDTDLIWEARLEGMAPEIDGKVYITEFVGVNDAAALPPPGSLATIEITGTKDYDLIGRVLEIHPSPRSRPAATPIPTNQFFPILASS